MSNNQLSEGDVRLLGQAWQCFKDGGTSINANIDFEKLAKLAGHTNFNSTRNRMTVITKKLQQMNGDADAGNDAAAGPSAPASPTTPSTATKAKGKGAGTKRKQPDTPTTTTPSANMGVKMEEGEDEPATPIPTPKKARGRPAGRAKKDSAAAKEELVAAKEDPDAAEEEPAAAKKSPATKATPRKRAKKVKKEPVSDPVCDSVSDAEDEPVTSPIETRGRSPSARSQSADAMGGFAPLNGKCHATDDSAALTSIAEDAMDTGDDQDDEEGV